MKLNFKKFYEFSPNFAKLPEIILKKINNFEKLILLKPSFHKPR